MAKISRGLVNVLRSIVVRAHTHTRREELESGIAQSGFGWRWAIMSIYDDARRSMEESAGARACKGACRFHMLLTHKRANSNEGMRIQCAMESNPFGHAFGIWRPPHTAAHLNLKYTSPASWQRRKGALIVTEHQRSVDIVAECMPTNCPRADVDVWLMHSSTLQENETDKLAPHRWYARGSQRSARGNLVAVLQ